MDYEAVLTRTTFAEAGKSVRAVSKAEYDIDGLKPRKSTHIHAPCNCTSLELWTTLSRPQLSTPPINEGLSAGSHEGILGG